MAFDKKAYDMEYAKQNITRKHIPFNLTNKEDADLLAWLNKQENVTQYVKRLIREDMEQHKAFEEAERRAEDAAQEVSGLSFPAQDGYRDEEAIKEFEEKGHRLFVYRQNGWDVRIDLDAKKVLTVRDISGLSVPGCRRIL